MQCFGDLADVSCSSIHFLFLVVLEGIKMLNIALFKDTAFSFHTILSVAKKELSKQQT